MRENERAAHALRERLGPEARVENLGVHWEVKVERARRTCRVHCFWYGEPRSDEYLVQLAGDGPIASGRTREVDAVSEAVRRWLDGASRSQVEAAAPFVEEKRRALKQWIAVLEPACRDVARFGIEGEEVHCELWVYGRDRSCELISGDAVRATFWLGPERVAAGVTVDPAAAISRWLRGATLAELNALGIEIAPHAEVLERGDVARWHWLRVRDRLANPDDVLQDSKAIVERLAARALPTRFFIYTSHDRVCFSASSHHEWVNRGMPSIYPPYARRNYLVEIDEVKTECDLEQAIANVERVLATYPVAPFFGTEAHRALEPLNAALAAAGTPMRAELRQRGPSFDVKVANGERYCTLSDPRGVSFHVTDGAALHTVLAQQQDVIPAARRWLEDGWSLDEIRAMPSVTWAAFSA